MTKELNDTQTEEEAQTSSAISVYTENDRKAFALKLLAEGYTTRAIHYKMVDAELEPYEETKLVSMRQQYAPDIADMREREEVNVLQRGLARRAERVRRLTRLAEKFEISLDLNDPTTVPHPKLSREFRQTLDQIRGEVDPLGLGEALDPNDKWVVLIMNLMDESPERQNMDIPALGDRGRLDDVPGA